MKSSQRPEVYLLHFSQPVSHARHYIGFSTDVVKRVQHHQQGEGNPLVKAAASRGSIQLARIWSNGSRSLERKLKNRKEAPRLCPICNPRAWLIGNYFAFTA